MNKKENAIKDFDEMIKKSWTYARFTKKEVENWKKIINFIEKINELNGNYRQRWKTLNTIYYAYLVGIGYEGWNWRNEEKENGGTKNE